MSDVENKALLCPAGRAVRVSGSRGGTQYFVHARDGNPCHCRAPRQAKRAKRGAPTNPVDASAIPQESHTGKADAKAVRRSGYRVPPHHVAQEETGGDIEKANHALEQQRDPRLRGVRTAHRLT